MAGLLSLIQRGNKEQAASPAKSDSSKKVVGLACAGGVVEGAIYEIGALCALEEAIEGLRLNQLDAYVGVSSGGLIAASLANGIPIRSMALAIINRSDEEELNLHPEMMFSFAFGEYMKRIAKIPGALRKSVEYYFRRPADWSLWGSIATWGELIPTGVFDNSRIESYARKIFSKSGRSNDFRKLGPRLHIIATELDSSDVVCFGDENYRDVPISRAVQASTALPGLYTPVRINGRYYIDGVARRTVHVSSLLDAGTGLVFCVNPIVPINTHLPGRTEKKIQRQLVEYGLPTVMSQTLRTLVSSRMKTGFKRYDQLYPDSDLILIEPEVDDFDVFFSNIFSFSNRHRVCEMAYKSTRELLLQKADEIEKKLEKYGLRLRREVLKDGSRTLFADHMLGRRSFPLRQAPLAIWNQVNHSISRIRDSFL